MLWEAEDRNIETFAVEQNAFVDITLDKMYRFHGKRCFTFSCFSPEICILNQAAILPGSTVQQGWCYSCRRHRSQQPTTIDPIYKRLEPGWNRLVIGCVCHVSAVGVVCEELRALCAAPMVKEAPTYAKVQCWAPSQVSQKRRSGVMALC